MSKKFNANACEDTPDDPYSKIYAQGVKNLNDWELIYLILESQSKSHTPHNRKSDTTARCLGQPGVKYLAGRSLQELETTYGISSGKACALSAALELGRRAQGPDCACITTPQLAYAHLQDLMEQDKEYFKALYLDTKKHLIKGEIISIGDLSSSIVHPREVFRPALKYCADSLIVAHNHPSGDPQPSAADIDVTRKLEKAGKILGITLADHIIVGRGCYSSLRQEGII